MPDVPQCPFRGHGPLPQTHCRSPVGAGSAREEGAAVCQMYRSAPFAATDRSYRHTAVPSWERALPAKRTPRCVRCTAALLSRPRTAPTDTLQVTCGSGLCPRRGHRGMPDVPQCSFRGNRPLLQTHRRSPVGAGSPREEHAAVCQMYRSASFAATDRSYRHTAGHLWERALPAKRTTLFCGQAQPLAGHQQ